jgi:hypothetical protein
MLCCSEFLDPALAADAFAALRALHATGTVHGDVTAANIVWDPSGHYFQLVDFEFATWLEGPSGDDQEAARVASPVLAVPPLHAALRASPSRASPDPHEGSAKQQHQTVTVQAAGSSAAWQTQQASPEAQAALARGSTAAVRLSPHGTYEHASLSQLLGCWPCCADDAAGLSWTLVSQHCPRALWWGARVRDVLGELRAASGEGAGVPESAQGPDAEAIAIAHVQARQALTASCCL